jgi:hypothetical protein
MINFQQKRERKNLLTKEWSKRRYEMLKGTPMESIYYPRKPFKDRFYGPISYERGKLWARLHKRINVFKKGGTPLTKGLNMRCECGKLTINWVRDQNESIVLMNKLGSLCKLHQ